MAETTSSPGANWVFDRLFGPWMRRRLEAVRLAGLPEDPIPAGSALILCPNHSSWWDGFLAREVHRALRPERPLFTVMLESELETRPWLRRLGAVGIRPGSVGGVRSALRELRALRQAHPDGLDVTFFPQGRIAPSFRRPLGFRDGTRLLARVLGPCRVLPLAIHLEPGSTPGPTAWIATGPLLDPARDSLEARALERYVEGELDLIASVLATWGEDAHRAWPRAADHPAPGKREPGRPLAYPAAYRGEGDPSSAS